MVEEVRERPPLDADDDRAPEPRLAGAPADERQPEPVDAVAEQREDRRQQGRRGSDRGQPDEDRAGGEAAQDRVGHEQHPGHGDHERRPAEEDRAARGPPRRHDRLDLLGGGGPLFAEAADDEERVVDAEREPHPREHVDDEEGDLPDLADDRDERERDDDRDDREQDRDQPRDDGAEDEQQHDQRRRQPEEELALLQILVREREEVVVGGELARDRHRERPVVGLLDDVDHVLDPVLGIPPHPDRDRGRIAVGREQAWILIVEVGADPRRAPGRLQRRHQPQDLALRLPVRRHVSPGRTHEHDLVDVVARRRQVLEDRVVALLRLGVVRDGRVGGDRRR